MKQEKDYEEMRTNLLVGAQVAILPLLVLIALFNTSIIGPLLKFALIFFIVFVIVRTISLTISNKHSHKRWCKQQNSQ
ncbi:hypothetical protein OBO34_20855 [Clostridiales Family XIII bacterium ASD5510]|uniref:Uncharacterized protein n=1 Tax=Hominibacterium faecale TaxID=2839743 RepID=A0A9J6QZ69_9FIRM|nr:hypothetical protein [Hominibacterium faecale]MCU7380767.1 hypothetical protein [Hominibacterium faecale]